MKAFISACVIFALLCGGVFFNAYYVTNTLDGLRETLSAIPLPEEDTSDLLPQYDALCRLEERWHDHSIGVSMTVNHADLMEAELQFATAKGAAFTGSRDDYLIAVSDLDYALEHLSEMADFSWKNIF